MSLLRSSKRWAREKVRGAADLRTMRRHRTSEMIQPGQPWRRDWGVTIITFVVMGLVVAGAGIVFVWFMLALLGQHSGAL